VTDKNNEQAAEPDHGIAFGLVLGPGRSGREWANQARVTEGQGFTSLLMPDTLWTPSPFPTLAAAAAVTSTLRLRTWVIAAPLRSPTVVVRETSTLQLLSDGRFELGIGTGRPDAEREAAQLGVPWGTAGQRIGQVQDVINQVREHVNPAPQIIVTAAGPRMLAAAGRSADRVALALPPMADEQDLATAVDRARSAGATRLSLQLTGLAGRLPDWLNRSGLDPQNLADAGAVGMLTGGPAEMADTLALRTEQFGIDEFIVPGDLAEYFAPVISRLSR
jgi:alkanesulfonate monooxygenase SsuD/methylene tetrahydromethanopterin reductase-like flavin-dependent oxidoreductase (luciferase family)